MYKGLAHLGVKWRMIYNEITRSVSLSALLLDIVYSCLLAVFSPRLAESLYMFVSVLAIDTCTLLAVYSCIPKVWNNLCTFLFNTHN